MMEILCSRVDLIGLSCERERERERERGKRKRER